MTIYFYSATGELGYLSNFSPHGFEIDDTYWATVEHYFQAQKFHNTPYEKQIQHASTPKEAKTLGRRRDFPLRADWETVKEDIMRRGCLAKFRTHADIRAKLLATHSVPLVEAAPSDYYWGCGADGSGKNRLGIILQEVRHILSEESA